MDVLEPTVAEIEQHVHAAGWDRPPALFALVRAGRFTADDPATAQRLGIDQLPEDDLTPVEQEDLPDTPLDELLGQIVWPDSVAGCAVTQEIVILPPSAEAELDAGDPLTADQAVEHPDRREARLAVGVLRDGTTATLLRLRPVPGAAPAEGDDAPDPDERLTGTDLAPNLARALLATFDE